MNNIQLRLRNVFLLVLGLAVSHVALAKDIEVSSANPSEAIQGTLNLDVEISGNGFDNQVDQVEFLLPCPPEEEPCTDTGGITVKGWNVRGKRKIIANIDVAADADVADFDIAVHSASGGGRGGKGTTLFSGSKPGPIMKLLIVMCLLLVGLALVCLERRPPPPTKCWATVRTSETLSVNGEIYDAHDGAQYPDRGQL